MRTLLYSWASTRVKQLACLTVLLLPAMLSAGHARAEAEEAEEQPAAEARPTPSNARWVVSLAATSGITVQEMDSSVESRCENGGTLAPACGDPSQGEPGPLRPSDSGTDLAVTPFVGGELQIMTPTLDWAPGGPRVFAAGGLIALFSAERRIAKEGNPTEIGIPDFTGGPVGVSTDALTGRGSATDSEVQTLGVGAHMGLAFPFEAGKRRLWLKPSFGWMRYEVDVTGRLVAGFKDRLRPEIREIPLKDKSSRVLNGIGPGLELEMETGRYGPIASSLFVAASAYKMLGDRTMTLRDELSCPACTEPDDGLGPDTYNARWTWRADSWMYRWGLGLRLHWLGDD